MQNAERDDLNRIEDVGMTWTLRTWREKGGEFQPEGTKL